MKLAMLTSALDEYEKEEGFIVDWVKSLAHEIDQLVIFTLKPQRKHFKTKKIKVYSLSDKKTKLAKLLYLLIIFHKEHRNKRFDGTFCHMYDFLGLLNGLLGKIFCIRSVMWYAVGTKLSYYSIVNLALRLNDEIITCSGTEKMRYQNAFRLKKQVHIFGHAINPKRFSQKKTLVNKSFFIGYSCRVTPKKNIETLIRAINHVKVKRKLNIYLLLSRTRENQTYYKKIKGEISKNKMKNIKYKIVKNIPYKDINKYYNKLHLYVHPSLMRSIDKAGIEAIVSKTPVLLSRFGFEEVCKKHKDILFNPKDAHELAQKIEYTINNYRTFSKKQHQLQKNIRASFSTKAFMKKLVSLYN